MLPSSTYSQPSSTETGPDTGVEYIASLDSIPEPVYSGELPYSFISSAVSANMAAEGLLPSLDLSSISDRPWLEWSATTNGQVANGSRTISEHLAVESSGAMEVPTASFVTLMSFATQLSTEFLLSDLQEIAKKATSRTLTITAFEDLLKHLRASMMRELRNYRDCTLALNSDSTLWDEQQWRSKVPRINNTTRTSIVYDYKTMAMTILVLNEKYRSNSEEIGSFKREQSYSLRVPPEIHGIESTWFDNRDSLANLWYRLKRYWELFAEKGEQGKVAPRQYTLGHGFPCLGTHVFPGKLRDTLSLIFATELRGDNTDYATATPSDPLETVNPNVDLVVQQLAVSMVHKSSLQGVVLPLIQSRTSRCREDALDALLGFFWLLLSGMIPSEIAKPETLEYEDLLFNYWMGLGREWLEAGTPVMKFGTEESRA
ncbi:hypothetical protein NliqN6_3368 [Naganishia liquefaciens]|uniref:Uncharacterized protein n=1 Tax=Naganishia liquefaciens TaxID=104408 RepID=A0A8H3YGS8_9TREE|nr:hypothetical protein NliqN6_3368 [Naganishia liquefaciens]